MARAKVGSTTAKSHKANKPGAKPRGKGSSSLATTPTPITSSLPQLSSRGRGPSQSDDPPFPSEKEVEENQAVPQELPPEKQSWYRPSDSKARKWVEKIVVHRAAGRSDHEIAKILKLSDASVRQYVWLGKKNRWLDDDGQIEDVEAELALNIDRKIVRNVSASLDGRMTNWQTHEMTLAAAKGRGIFKDHSKNESTAQTMSVVAIKIEMPAVGAANQVVDEVNVGGVPAYVEGEVEDGDRLLPSALPDSPV